ncbi:MAG: NAD-dependent epimerase/dehydratase family protein [Vicinamibacterales bacterium]
MRATSRDLATVRGARCAIIGIYGGDALRGRAWTCGESVSMPAKYYRNNVTGGTRRPRGHGEPKVSRCSCSRRPAPSTASPVETPIANAIHQHPINTYGESKLAWSAPSALTSGLTASARSRSVTSTHPARTPTARLARTTRRKSTSSPAQSKRPRGGRGLQVFGDDYPTPDGTCLRDYIHVTDLADAHVKALDGDRRRPARRASFNLGTGRPHSVKEVIDAVEQVTGRRVPWTLAPRREGDPAVLYAAAEKAQRELRWTPRFPDLESIVRTAWQLASSRILTDTDGRAEVTTPPRCPALSPISRPYRARLAWAVVAMVFYAIGFGRTSSALIKTIFDKVLQDRSDLGLVEVQAGSSCLGLPWGLRPSIQAVRSALAWAGSSTLAMSYRAACVGRGGGR